MQRTIIVTMLTIGSALSACGRKDDETPRASSAVLVADLTAAATEGSDMVPVVVTFDEDDKGLALVPGAFTSFKAQLVGGDDCWGNQANPWVGNQDAHIVVRRGAQGCALLFTEVRFKESSEVVVSSTTGLSTADGVGAMTTFRTSDGRTNLGLRVTQVFSTATTADRSDVHLLGLQTRVDDTQVDVRNSCLLPWGGEIEDGESVQAFTSAMGNPCKSETRTCRDGKLDGTATYKTCETWDKPTCNLSRWPEVIDWNEQATIYWSAGNTNDCTIAADATHRRQFNPRALGTGSGSFTTSDLGWSSEEAGDKYFNIVCANPLYTWAAGKHCEYGPLKIHRRPRTCDKAFPAKGGYITGRLSDGAPIGNARVGGSTTVNGNWVSVSCNDHKITKVLGWSGAMSTTAGVYGAYNVTVGFWNDPNATGGFGLALNLDKAPPGSLQAYFNVANVSSWTEIDGKTARATAIFRPSHPKHTGTVAGSGTIVLEAQNIDCTCD